MNIVIYHEQRLGQWWDVNKDKMRAYPNVCVIMGINNLPKITDYWSSDIFTGNNGIKRTMTKNGFEEISQFFHLNNSSEEPAHGEENFDRLYKCRPALTSLLRNAQPYYSLKKNISTNKGMMAFKGRLSFRQYLPAKPTKYGIKVWMAADASNGYIVNFSVYLESEGQKRRIHGIGYDVVMNKARPLLNRNHHVFFDNFFSSPILLEHLLDQQTYTCSTVWCTRRDLPPCAKNKLHQLGQNGTTKGMGRFCPQMFCQMSHSNCPTNTKWTKCPNQEAACLRPLHEKYGRSWSSRSTLIFLYSRSAVAKVV